MLYKKYIIELKYKTSVISDVINNSTVEDTYNNDINIKILHSYTRDEVVNIKYIDHYGVPIDYPIFFDFKEDAEFLLETNGYNISNSIANYVDAHLKISEVYNNHPIDVKKLRKYKINKLLNNGTYIPSLP